MPTRPVCAANQESGCAKRSGMADYLWARCRHVFGHWILSGPDPRGSDEETMKSVRSVLRLSLAVFGSYGAFGQSGERAPAFDVVSVKPSGTHCTRIRFLSLREPNYEIPCCWSLRLAFTVCRIHTVSVRPVHFISIPAFCASCRPNLQQRVTCRQIENSSTCRFTTSATFA